MLSPVATNVNDLFGALMQLTNLMEAVPPPPPISQPATLDEVRSAVDSGAHLLPWPFRSAYAEPLERNLRSVVERLAGPDQTVLEAVTGAVYQHSGRPSEGPLNRFLAVVSNLYRSFLDSRKRIAADFPLNQALPPLAMFQYQARSGPFTIPVDNVAALFGGAVGVVSMPASYANHPLLWAALAHECTGHDVLHADPALLPELKRGARAVFSTSDEKELGLIWDYWMDEAASDVYGALNVGPTFAHNLVLLFSLISAQRAHPPGDAPILRTQSGPADRASSLDPHPTDLLRLSLLEGAVASLQGLSAARKQSYVGELRAMAGLAAPGASSIELQGWLRFDNGERHFVNGSFPLVEMQDAARRVGKFIATTTLDALGGHAIQALETWDDADEQTARRIADALAQGMPITGIGDDAQLLAGVTMACLANPASYADSTRALEEALDDSFAHDPFWGLPRPDRAFSESPPLERPAFTPDPTARELIEHDAWDEAPPVVPGVVAPAVPVPDAIPWPAGTAPRAEPFANPPAADDPLPHCDFVAITWTVDEANAMSALLTPGVRAVRRKGDPADLPTWYPYRHGWDGFAPRIRHDSPAGQKRRLGSYHLSRFGEGADARTVLCFKSELHLSQDGPDLPLPDLFRQIITETQARLVITTGTAGAIGPDLKLGDVVVASRCRFDLLGGFKGRPFNGSLVSSQAVSQPMSQLFTAANADLLAANAPHLRPQRLSTPRIFWSSDALGEPPVVVTTDIFAFDDAGNAFGLQGLGAMVEMDDALLGLACEQITQAGGAPPAWLAIRNASDPQMDGPSVAAEKKEAARIYKRYGFWTTVPSVVATWAAIRGF
jgi:hypothetical protein